MARSQAVREEALRLRQNNTPYDVIGRMLDVPPSTIRYWIKPGYRERSCLAAAEWRRQNPEKAKEANREYSKSHRKEHAARQRGYSAKYPEKKRARDLRYRSEHREEIAQMVREWKKTPTGRLSRRLSQMKRRAAKNEGEGITQLDVSNKLLAQEGRCFYCGVEMSTDGDPSRKDYMTIDHVIPLSKGGPHSCGNTVLSCRSCNCRKGAR